MVFDPTVITFGALLQGFGDRAVRFGGFGQYRTAVFPRDKEQLEATVDRFGAVKGIVPPGRPESVFWDAEDYHQKYRLRSRRRFVATLAEDLGATWDRFPVATKLNASVGADLDPGPWLALLPSASREEFARSA